MVMNSPSYSRESAPASASVDSSDGRMVLRVKSSENMNMASARKRSRPLSGKKSRTETKKKAAKIDAMKPKKPPTAFFYFLEDFRKEFQEQNPDVKSMRHIGKACGNKWKTMSYEEKVQYYDIATQKRAEFDVAMAEYNKRMENGEEEESEENSDFN